MDSYILTINKLKDIVVSFEVVKKLHKETSATSKGVKMTGPVLCKFSRMNNISRASNSEFIRND
ncbi:Hypothetical protein FKW44_005339 [Caligus rogercresseyi]|uniref:Uncharacterized protein n=1 Tax=Caligus rogercresseyi TaxID=217165 RepID=A0A7T8QRX8_CALRO|nr:Hypothetical protein FKW44_005339 [Caligus rogercresseyi]